MRGRSVLIVEDDESLRLTLAFALQREGYDIRQAGDGASGLRLAHEHLPDLVLLDIMMPVMDGWEFLRRFHEGAETRVPVVALTAVEVTPERSVEMGIAGFLRKPCSLGSILAEIPRALGQPPLSAAATV